MPSLILTVIASEGAWVGLSVELALVGAEVVMTIPGAAVAVVGAGVGALEWSVMALGASVTMGVGASEGRIEEGLEVTKSKDVEKVVGDRVRELIGVGVGVVPEVGAGLAKV